MRFDRIALPEGQSDRLLLLDNGDELAGLLEKIEEDAVKP